ncbi:MAG: lipoyl(octanoyl) transferase LipB [Candidatus Binatia bacterium]
MILYCIDPGLIDYAEALAWQDALVQQRCAGNGNDTLLLLEHPPVFTLGRGADERHVLTPRQTPVHRVSRGGEVTFHGPGQLVGYPVLHLDVCGRDVHAYLRTLESVLIDVLAEFGVRAESRVGLTGVWVNERKIASIGIGVRRWVAYHGFALNVDPDLSYFADIVPCGLNGVRMTSMTECLGYAVDVPTVKVRTAERFARRLGYEETLWRKNCPTQHSTSEARR